MNAMFSIVIEIVSINIIRLNCFAFTSHLYRLEAPAFEHDSIGDTFPARPEKFISFNWMRLVKTDKCFLWFKLILLFRDR
jgi:hypothetical protein